MDRIVRILALVITAASFSVVTSTLESAPNDVGEEALARPDLPLTGPSGEVPPRLTRIPPIDSSAAQAPAKIPPVETASPLKSAEPDHERSEQLEQIAQQVDRQTRHGLDLAGRGAYLAARAEFLGAMKLLTEGLDTEGKTDAHGRALAAALSAMKEAEDFLPNDSRLRTSDDLARIISTHTTPVLKTAAGNVTAIAASKCYFTFAQEQFAAAAGNEVAGSMALHALGKLHNALAQKKSGLVPAAESKAMVFYQAALLACPKNLMAANDLGVLLAQCGHAGEARLILEHSLSLSQQAVTWHNLAVVYGQLGQQAEARWADYQATVLQQAESSRKKMSARAADNSVLWTDSQTFAQTSSSTPSSPGVMPSSVQAAPLNEPGRMTPATQATKGAARPPSAAERMSWGVRSYK
jgi:hypothetical protein